MHSRCLGSSCGVFGPYSQLSRGGGGLPCGLGQGCKTLRTCAIFSNGFSAWIKDAYLRTLNPLERFHKEPVAYICFISKDDQRSAGFSSTHDPPGCALQRTRGFLMRQN